MVAERKREVRISQGGGVHDVAGMNEEAEVSAAFGTAPPSLASRSSFLRAIHYVDDALNELGDGWAEGGEHEVADFELGVGMVQVAGQSEGVAAALKAEVVLFLKVFLMLRLHSVGSVLSVPESRRAEAWAGDSAMLDGRGRVAKGQRGQVLGERGACADEVELEQFLRPGEGCKDAFEELVEHCCSVEMFRLIAGTEGGCVWVEKQIAMMRAGTPGKNEDMRTYR